MSDVSSFRALVVSVVTGAVADTSVPVQWRDEGRKWGSRHAVLDVVSMVPHHDRKTVDPDTLVETFSTEMVFTLQLAIESIHDSSPIDSMWLLQRVRVALLGEAARAELFAGDTSLVDTDLLGGPTAKISFPSDGRQVSSHSLELVFRTVLDFSPGTTTFEVQTVVVAGETDTVDETGIPVDLSVTYP